MGIAEEIETLNNDSEKAHSEATEESDRIRKQLEALRARIKNGESSGDRLRDFALIYHGDDLAGTVTKVYHDLEASLVGKKGQLFIIGEYDPGYRDPFEQESNGGCFGYPPSRTERHPDTLGIGFLSDERLNVDMTTGTWMIPCREYAFKKRQAGSIGFTSVNAMHMFLLGKLGRNIGGEQAPCVVVGDVEVVAWFRQELHRFASDEDVIKRDLVRRTLELEVPSEHFLCMERVKLRTETLTEIERLDGEIRGLRDGIEHPDAKLKSDAAIVIAVSNIRAKIAELGQKLDLAIKLGVDPDRPEILRMRENFGHYWKT